MICITLFLIHESYFITFISIILLFVISKFLFLIDNTVSKSGFKYNTLILFHKGNIKYNTIESIEKIKFSIFFQFYKLKLYQYCNSNKCSSVKYGIKINLKNGESIIVPSNEPKELKQTIEMQLK